MRMIDKFVNEVLKNPGAFNMQDSRGRYYFFIQDVVGNARYVYSYYTYQEKNKNAALDNKPELTAIVADGKVYIYNTYVFNDYSVNRENYPENAISLFDYVGEKNAEAAITFKKFYDELPIDENNIGNVITEGSYEEKEARRYIFNFKEADNPTIKNGYSIDDVAQSLCGYINLDDVLTERLADDRDTYIRRKEYEIGFKRFINGKIRVADYEMRIAECLKSIDAKSVTVEFTVGDKKAVAKIAPSKIIKTMASRDTFSNWEFDTKVAGENLLLALGLPMYNSKVGCGNISKILFRGKTIYER